MAMVVRVRFRRASKFYDFDPNGLELHTGMHVITETVRGVEMGECMSGVLELPEERVVAPLRPILRIATEADIECLSGAWHCTLSLRLAMKTVSWRPNS